LHSSSPLISATSVQKYAAKLATIEFVSCLHHEIANISPDFINLWDDLAANVSDTICANDTLSKSQMQPWNIVNIFAICEISSISHPLQAIPLLF